MDINNFLLVTGLPRSGTTPVGELLTLDWRSFYIYEPMNFDSGDECIPEYFAIPGDGTFDVAAMDDFLRRLADMNLKLRPGAWPHETGWIKIRKRFFGGRSRVSHAICRWHPLLKRIVWKDPFALFAVPNLIDRTTMPIVITRRPVGGLAASFKRFNWGFDSRSILRRLNHKDLPATLLEGVDLSDPVVNAACLWNIGDVMTTHYARNARVKVVDIADLIDAPLAVTKDLYDHCGLDFTPAIAQQVEKRYKPSKGKDIPTGNKAHVKNRNVQAVNTYWKTYLTDDDHGKIAAIAERFASLRRHETF